MASRVVGGDAMLFFYGGFRLEDSRFLSWQYLNLDRLSRFLSAAAVERQYLKLALLRISIASTQRWETFQNIDSAFAH